MDPHPTMALARLTIDERHREADLRRAARSARRVRAAGRAAHRHRERPSLRSLLSRLAAVPRRPAAESRGSAAVEAR